MAQPIADNVQRVQERIFEACQRANRDPQTVTLVAVSKRMPVADVLAAWAGGVQHFGENRVEEANTKISAVASQLPADAPMRPVWHMIGHVQSRKVKQLALFDVTHSVDSVKLAQQLAKLAGDMPPPRVFLQVNVSGEPQKHGFEGYRWEQDAAVRAQLFEELGQVLALSQLRVQGLMTMAPFNAPEPVLRQVFASLSQLRDRLQTDFGVSLPDLSMGMTDDYPIAIEEGATLVRVGRAIFGERDNE